MLILAMAFTLAACAAKPAETTEPAETTAPAGTEKTEEAAAQPADESAAEPVELSILTRYGDDTDVNARVFREAVAAFAAEHPEVTINDMSVTDETQFNNLFKTCMATADIPTIFMTYGGGNLCGQRSGRRPDAVSGCGQRLEGYVQFHHVQHADV